MGLCLCHIIHNPIQPTPRLSVCPHFIFNCFSREHAQEFHGITCPPPLGLPTMMLLQCATENENNCEGNKQTDRGRERTVHPLCWHNPSHFSHNAAWKTHPQSLLTTCKCYCHTINCRTNSCRARWLQWIQLIGHTFRLCWLKRRQSQSPPILDWKHMPTSWHLCVCLNYKTGFSVTLDATITCGQLKVTHRRVLCWLHQFIIWVGKDSTSTSTYVRCTKVMIVSKIAKASLTLILQTGSKNCQNKWIFK